MINRPALCFCVQGAKELAVGETRAACREGQMIVTTSDAPTLGYVSEANPRRPYLGIGLELDLAGLREVIEQLPPASGAFEDPEFELFVDDISEPIRDCIIRLVDAAARPHAMPILQPAIMREIYYWLLTGPNGEKIARQVRISASARRIADVVHVLRENFTRPISVDRLAELAKMSPSSFFQHFKSATSMTPLQFQKQLRLLEARRLLVMTGLSVGEAAIRVGYESTSQFSREYSRMFGLPPARDTSFFSGAAPSSRAG